MIYSAPIMYKSCYTFAVQDGHLMARSFGCDMYCPVAIDHGEIPCTNTPVNINGEKSKDLRRVIIDDCSWAAKDYRSCWSLYISSKEYFEAHYGRHVFLTYDYEGKVYYVPAIRNKGKLVFVPMRYADTGDFVMVSEEYLD